MKSAVRKKLPPDVVLLIRSIGQGGPITDVDEWVRINDYCLSASRMLVRPETREQFLVADEIGWLEAFPYLRPWPAECRHFGLRKGFGHPVEPFPEEFRRRLVATAEADPAFCKALSKAVRVGVKS